MDSSKRGERRSERKRKRKESYSPDGHKSDNVVKKSKCKSRANRPYDILPNGEPFSCHMCKSPYVVNTLIKKSKKPGTSRHTPLPKVRIDKNTGKEIMLCNGCVQLYDRPQRRTTVKPVIVPSEAERKAYLDEVAYFIKQLQSLYDDPLVERLFCPVSQKKLCGCLQKCINSHSDSATELVQKLVYLIKKAVELRKEKAYTVSNENRKNRSIGLGNGHKKSKNYEMFVITQRQYLKEDLHLCERATQKILLYSNNFLHKKLKTENRPCRIERTRGKAALGKLPDFNHMVDVRCCLDYCVRLVITHKQLLQDWRSRALQGQSEARRVVAEMLTPGALHTNCYSFINMVTGCCQSTISSVYNQMIDTGGVREPPEHGMKRVWQQHYKKNKTSIQGDDNVSISNMTSDMSNPRTDTPGSTVISDMSTINSLEAAARQNKLLWMQHFARSQLQQQLARQLQELVNKQKPVTKQTEESQTTPSSSPNTTNYSPSASSHTQSTYQQQLVSQGIPNSSGTQDIQQLGQGHSNQGQAIQGHSNQGQSIKGHSNQGQAIQGHSNQGDVQQIVLQPPPQYGVAQQPGAEKPLQYTFHIDLNQPNYMVTGDNQLVPVIPVFKYQGQSQGQMQGLPQGQIANAGTLGIESSLQQAATAQTPSHVQPMAVVPSHQLMNSNQMCQQILQQPVGSIPKRNVVSLPVSTDSATCTQQSQSYLPAVKEYHQIVTQDGMVVLQAPTGHPGLTPGSFIDIAQNGSRSVYVPVVSNQSNNRSETCIISTTPDIQSTNHAANSLPSVSGDNVSDRNHSVNNVSVGTQPSAGVKQSQAIINQLRYVPDSTLTSCHLKQAYDHDTVTSSSNSTSDIHSQDSAISDSSVVEGVPQTDTGHVNTVQRDDSGTVVTPVNYVPVLDSNSEQNDELPSQIQISFKTCSSTGDQIGFAQQIMVPHSNVVTLPLIPLTSTETASGQTSAVYEIPGDQLVSVNDNPQPVQPVSEVTTDGRKERLATVTTSEEGMDKTDFQLSRVKPVRSRNTSGRKSRHSSGPSEKLKKLSDLQHSQEVYLEVRNDHLTEGQFMSKLDKIRHRQQSGSSETEDRSRKSSGNSMISDGSSHISGLTLSNIASPNIFHDKDKGIFFMQSLEFSEIDSGHVAEFIQAVESDNAVNILRHQMDETGALLQ